jgi:eukaryotic-like serine/threonine-protein kinase
MEIAAAVAAIKYRAFISYSHQDEAWAQWLHKALETYRVPSRLVGTQTAAGIIPRRLEPIFRDRDELPSAADLSGKVNEALAQSAALIVICSPRSATSRWVNEEVLAFKRLRRSNPVFCLIVDGEPNATDLGGRAAEECFAPALRFRLGADGQPTRERTESIAADARAGRDGKANAKLKLISGLLDVGFDALKQREQHRRVRRMATITALALLVMLVTTMLAINAVIARRAALVARDAAERRQKQAESLVDFMLGDLNSKLAQVQRLDILEAVDDKAMQYFQSLPVTDVTDETLMQRAKALEKIGGVRMDQGHLPAAMESFQTAAKLSAALAEAAPDDTARQIAYSRVLAFVGMTDWYQGKLDAAQQSFESAQRVLQRDAARSSNNPQLLFQLTSIDNNVGHVLEARGMLDEAEVQYRSMLAHSDLLVAEKGAKPQWTAQLGGAHNNLGKLALMRGDLATAIAEYRADDALESGLVASDPKNNEQRENALVVHAILGRTLALAGDVEAGVRHLQQAVDTARELTKVDPNNTGFERNVALYASQLSRLRRLAGDLPAAQSLIAQSLSIYLSLTSKDAANADWQREYAEAQIEQAEQSCVAGNLDAGRKQVRAALAILQPLLARSPDDRSTMLAVVRASLLLATVTADRRDAQQLRDDALREIQKVKTGDGDPRLLALQVEALIGSGRKADAQPIIRQLWDSGYRDLALLEILRREGIDYPVNAKFQAQLQAANVGEGRP